MAKNLLIEYSESLACEIAVLCRNHQVDSNTVYQIKKSSSSVFANITIVNIIINTIIEPTETKEAELRTRPL